MLAGPLLGALPAAAQTAVDPERASAQELAERHAPIVSLVDQTAACDPDGEAYRPVPVAAVLDQPGVVLRDRSGAVLAEAPSAADLAAAPATAHLDLPGRALKPGCTYERWTREVAADLPTTTYARVVVAPEHERVLVQYWLYYVFNDWNNRHESDWEMVQVVFEASSVEEALAAEPVEIGFSQHEGAERADWDAEKLTVESGHPVVRPGAGSHANYFTEDLFLGHSAQEGFGCDDTRGPSTATPAEVVLLPDVVPTDPADPFAWLAYEGHWGEFNRGPNNGPTGPVTKEGWIDPVAWMDDEWRGSSTVVPAGGSFGSGATDFFCGAVAAGSEVYMAVLDRPLLVLGGLAAIVVFAVWLSRRTTWSPAPAFPIDAPRSTGEIIRAGARVYRRLFPLMAGIGLILIPVGAVAAGVQQAVFAVTPLGSLVSVAAEDELFGVAVALLLGSVAAVFAVAIVQAAVTAALLRVEAGGRPDAADSYAAIAPRTLAVLWGSLRTVALAAVLAVTVFGLPVAFYLVVRRVLLPQAVVAEGLGATPALRRSWSLTRGHAPRVAVVAVLTNVAVTGFGPVVATILMLLLSPPLWFVNLLAGLVGALVVPYSGIVLTLLYFDVRSDADADSDADPVPA